MFYFAYGTLLDIDVMKRIAPSVRSLGIMRLDGYRMGFAQCSRGDMTGCTLDEDPAEITYGVQYELSDAEMAGMDGAAVSGRDLWVHKPIKIIDKSGEQVDSLTYIIPGVPPAIAPSDDYVRPILKGLDDLEFPGGYVKKMKALIAAAQNSADA